MRRINILFEKNIRAIACLFCALIFVSIINGGLSFNDGVILCVLIILAIIVRTLLGSKKELIRKWKKPIKIICIVLIVVGFMARLAFFFLQDKLYISETLSDTGVHWYGAQQIVENGVFNQEVGEYERMFPYLSAYTVTLSIAMRIFGENFAAVLLSNIFFDIIGCIVLFVLFSKWKKSKNIGLLAATIWAINPLEIIFCGMPLAIVIVNVLVLLSILSLYLLWTNKSNIKKIVFWSLASGVVLAIGNAYRPIFIIFVIALVISVFINVMLKKNKTQDGVKNISIGIIVTVLSYIIVGFIPRIIHTNINPYYNGEKPQAGWSVYVGANYNTEGKWSSGDRDIFFGEILSSANNDATEAQKIIMRRGLSRYKENIFNLRLFRHFFNKISVLFSDVQNSIYDLPYIFNFKKDNSIYKTTQDIILIFYYIIVGLFGYSVYDLWKQKHVKNKSFDMFMILLFIGLFAASMLVEVMNRYSLPFITIFIIFAINGVSRSVEKMPNRS